jgi:hypothetical protein
LAVVVVVVIVVVVGVGLGQGDMVSKKANSNMQYIWCVQGA